MSLHSSFDEAALKARRLELAYEMGAPQSSQGIRSQMPANPEQRKQWLSERPLTERLKVSFIENFQDFEPIPPALLRKYVGYARKYVHPRLSPEAAETIQNFYLDLRRNHHSLDSTPITTRQLESLIRLSEARAKLELREHVTRQDAEEVIEIMKFAMLGTNSDEVGNIDFERSQQGTGMSQKAQAKRFVGELVRIAEDTYNTLFSMAQLREIGNKIGIRVDSFPDFIQKLNNENYLLKKGPSVYELKISRFS